VRERANFVVFFFFLHREAPRAGRPVCSATVLFEV